VALYPLIRPKDNLSDIPLTPTQRVLLGLDPSATLPPTPGSTYITPPKYRLSGSRAASPASRSASPLSASANASGRRVSSGASFSPSTSPLFQKAVSNGGRDSGRRPSFGSPSPLGRSSPFRESGFGSSIGLGSSMGFGSSMGPATPSPVGGKRMSTALSNKWLYERSRRLSASNGSL
jgi:nucleoporin POM34